MGKIIHYTFEYYDRLKAYCLKVWPGKSAEYFDYRFKEIPENPSDVEKNLIAINDEGQIVGCQLFFPTRALVHGMDTKVFWAHDTILDEEYRGDLGTDLMLSVNGIVFGAGLSEVNYKIQKKLKTPFLGTEHIYFILNVLSPLSLFLCLLRRGQKKVFNPYEKVKSKGYTFKYVTDVNQIAIPNNGYWFNSDSDVEFVRDAHFLDKRFIHNFNKYYLYSHEDENGKADMYFVLRITYGKGLPILSVVDFRYDKLNKDSLSVILNAANMLAMKNHVAFVRICTTMTLDKSLYSFMRKDWPTAVIVGPKTLKYDDPSSIVYTEADSDTDFIYQDNLV